jgi:hypothetical protein
MRSGEISAAYAWVKRRLISAGRVPRRIPIGLYRGLVLSLDLAHQSQLFVGLAEAETHSLIRLAASRARWMVDVGAGHGELSIFFAVKSLASKVYAVEPRASEIAVLRENIDLNRSNIRNEVIALKAYAGPLGSADSVQLDDLPVDRSLRGFVKIDVDGAEMAVLESGKSLLVEAKVDLLIETHSTMLERRCIQWLEVRGFAPRIIPNARWRHLIPERRLLEHNRWLWAASE